MTEQDRPQDPLDNDPLENRPLDTDPLARDTSASEAGEAPDTAALLAEIEQLKNQVAEARDQMLRTAAEAQNVRRRAEKDVENAHKYALEKFAAALLPVADNLERALEAADRENEAVKPFVEGVELTGRTLHDVLARFEVQALDPLGTPFDPTYHEAVSMVENPNVEPNTVLHVMQKGYTLHGRLLRAAMVMVARGPSKPVDASA